MALAVSWTAGLKADPLVCCGTLLRLCRPCLACMGARERGAGEERTLILDCSIFSAVPPVPTPRLILFSCCRNRAIGDLRLNDSSAGGMSDGGEVQIQMGVLCTLSLHCTLIFILYFRSSQAWGRDA